MRNLIKRSSMLLLALPVAAVADPVAVISHSIGTSTVNNAILNALGLDSVTTTDPLPYELTLSSSFDPDANPSTSEYAKNDGGKAVIDFHIGSQYFHRDGIAYSSAHRYAQSLNIDSYEHYIQFYTDGAPANSGYSLVFDHTLFGLPGSMGASGPLTPFHADESDSANGYYVIDAYPSNPDVPLSWQMAGYATPTISVNVAAVPEPASLTLLAAGLLSLGLRRRFGQVAM